MKTSPAIVALCFLLTAIACERSWSAGSADQKIVEAKIAGGISMPPNLKILAAKVPAEVRALVGRKRFVEVIIRLNTGNLEGLDSRARAARIAAVSDRVAAQVSPRHLRIIHRYSIVPIMAARANAEGLAALSRLDEVEEVVLDREDRAFLDHSTKLIDAHRAWPKSIGTGRLVAILDTGTDRSHPFVRDRIPYEACFRHDKKCNGAHVSYASGSARSMLRKHGMQVAGIAAGANGSWGELALSGVAPGAKIVAINVFSGDTSWVTDQIKALEYVARLKEQGVAIVAANLSLGGQAVFSGACDQAEKDRKTIIDILRARGVATVVAAGNRAFANAVSAPGCISSAVTVSSVTNMDSINTANSRSSQTDFMAPGQDIMSSVPGSAYTDGIPDYGNDNGTSMAAPHVSGAIALLSAAVPEATLGQIIAALSATGKPLPEGKLTYRRIDVDNALAYLKAH